MSFRRKRSSTPLPAFRLTPDPEADPLEAWLTTCEQPRPKTYAEEVRTRLVSAETARHTLVHEALSRNICEVDLPSLVADATNGGNLPRVFRGETGRGSGVELLLLSGPVEASELHIELTRGTEDSPQEARVVLSLHKTDLADGTPRLISTGLLPQTGPATPDAEALEVLARIDQFMTPGQ